MLSLYCNLDELKQSLRIGQHHQLDILHVAASSSVDGLGNLEGDGVVVQVEVGWILSHEDVTENEVVEASWEGHGLDTEEALTLHLEDVVG